MIEAPEAGSLAGSLIERLRRITLVVGKGGVGKTTCAAGIARQLANSGQRTLVVTTDPAGTLGEVIARGSGGVTVAPSAIAPRLDGWLLDNGALRNAFLDRWRETIGVIVDRGTYLDRPDIDGMIDAALPGADEIFGLLSLSDVVARTGAGRYDRVVIDTAPTGHTLRLLDLPATFRALVALLDAMQEKHRFMVHALTHRYARDRADDFVDETSQRLERLARLFTDAVETSAVLVVRPEPVVIAESVRYVSALAVAKVDLLGVVVNVWQGSTTEAKAVEPLTLVGGNVAWFTLPRSSSPPATLAEAGGLLAKLAPFAPNKLGKPAAKRRASPPAGSPEKALRASEEPPLLRALPFTLVGGKGGVGKTTVACALAIAAADAGHRVLLVSTDPAPSVADALAQPIGDAEQPVIGVDGLMARQMDAAAAFARLRDEYRDRIDSVFGAIVSGGLDAAHDRAILRDLLSLSPPGVDELYALTVLGDALEDARYTCVVVDPAPTGHFLRLLDMPALALDWSHRLMRLMLKYKDVVALGDAAQGLLDFAHRTRRLDARLHAPESTGVVEVALDEPLVRTESARLVGAIRERGIRVAALVWNRATIVSSPLPADPPVAQLVAESLAPPPVGVEALRAWSRGWKLAAGEPAAGAPDALSSTG